MNRRSYLRAASVAGAATLAGCSAGSSGQPTAGSDDNSAHADRPGVEQAVTGAEQPEFNTAVASDWRLLTQTDDQLTFDVGWWVFTDTVHADVRTTRYAYRPFERRLDRQTLGRYQGLATTFAASRLTFQGRLSGAVTPERARARVAEDIEETMGDMELQEVTRVPAPARTVEPVHPDGEHLEFTATHEVDPVVLDGAVLKDAPDTTLTLDGGTLDVRAFFCIWDPGPDDVLMVAGGAYATDETFARTATESLTGHGLGDGVDVTVDITLDLAPAHQLEALRTATGAVS